LTYYDFRSKFGQPMGLNELNTSIPVCISSADPQHRTILVMDFGK